MKKTRGRKGKNTSKKRKKSSFKGQLAVITVVATFLVFAFLLSFVGNPTGHAVSGQSETSGGTSFISDWFANWEQGKLDTNIAKYLLFFMLAGLIWGALDFAKFPEKPAFQALLALPVAFLATAYITPQEVFTILQSYTTMGIVLTFLVPFIIMVFVSTMLLSNEKIKRMSLPKTLLEFFLWIFFGVILFYKMISGFVTGQIDFGLNLSMIITLGVFTIVLLIIFFHGAWRKMVWRLGNEMRRAKSEAERTEAGEAVRTSKEVERAREERR